MTHGELWQKTLAELQWIYGEKGLTPDPLPQEAIEALRVPGVYGGEVTQPLHSAFMPDIGAETALRRRSASRSPQ